MNNHTLRENPVFLTGFMKPTYRGVAPPLSLLWSGLASSQRFPGIWSETSVFNGFVILKEGKTFVVFSFHFKMQPDPRFEKPVKFGRFDGVNLGWLRANATAPCGHDGCKNC